MICLSVSEKKGDARYLVFTVNICNLGSVTISWDNLCILQAVRSAFTAEILGLQGNGKKSSANNV